MKINGHEVPVVLETNAEKLGANIGYQGEFGKVTIEMNGNKITLDPKYIRKTMNIEMGNHVLEQLCKKAM